MTSKQILIYGPHAEEYSLAKINRELAFGLHTLKNSDFEGFDVKLSADPADVARVPNQADVQKYPLLADVYEPYNPGKVWDMVIYNNFPKDPNAKHGLSKLNANIKIAYLAWEEDRFPKRWVDEYNQNLDAVFAATMHTRRVLLRSGVNLPIVVVPNALANSFFAYAEKDLADLQNVYPIKSNKQVRFFHNSSGLARKGVDELIKAYFSAFSTADDVALIIKSFPNASNLFRETIAKYQQPDSPEVEIIEAPDLTEEEMISIYKQCHFYISPSRAEGFNLPALEAMLLKLPLLVTGWSGQMDFCNDRNAYLLDYELKPAKSHLDNPGAFWAEVDVEDLVEKLKLAYDERGSEKQGQMVNHAYQTALNYNWNNSAKLTADFLSKLTAISETKKKRLAVISTYNSVCGIAEYSSYLYGNLEKAFAKVYFIANSDASNRTKVDAENVARLWEYGEADFARFFAWLEEEKTKNSTYPIDFAHIQYNLGFYTMDALRALIEGLKTRKIPIILTAHAVQAKNAELDYLKDTLPLVDQIHVLNQDDVRFLENIGLKNIYYFPHGNITFPYQPQQRVSKQIGITEYSPVVATHGFMVKGKGLINSLSAVKTLKEKYPHILLLAMNAVNPNNIDSKTLDDQYKALISELGLEENVVHIADFIDREEVLVGLSAADLHIFAYDEAAETASGAIRLALATAKPIVGTRSKQLLDLNETLYLVPNNSADEIAKAVVTLLEAPESQYEYSQKSKAYADKYSWEKLGLDYLMLVSHIQSK